MPQDRRDAHWTDSDVCWSTRRAVRRTAGPMAWPSSFPPAPTWFSRCTTWPWAEPRATRPAWAWSSPSSRPRQRVLTLQLTNDRFVIPPGVDDYRVEVHGTLPNDATLLSFFPHMHLRGKQFEYNLIRPDGSVIETLLRVHYDFHWQLSYRLAEPRFLKAGTELQAVAWYRQFQEQSAQPGSRRRP